jgi:hypothetical protein
MRDGGLKGPAIYVPVSRRLSAAGNSLLGHPIPAGELGPPYGRLTGHEGPGPDGVTTFRTHELRPGWVPPLPRGRWCSSRLRAIPSRHLPFPSGQSLSLATSSHQRGSCDEASTEVHAIYPSGLPLACGPRMGREPLGFPLSSEPRRPEPTTHVRVGPGHRAQARNYAIDISRTSNLRVLSSTCDLVSQLLPRLLRALRHPQSSRSEG